jgi:hypothetical protein
MGWAARANQMRAAHIAIDPPARAQRERARRPVLATPMATAILAAVAAMAAPPERRVGGTKNPWSKKRWP